MLNKTAIISRHIIQLPRVQISNARRRPKKSRVSQSTGKTSITMITCERFPVCCFTSKEKTGYVNYKKVVVSCHCTSRQHPGNFLLRAEDWSKTDRLRALEFHSPAWRQWSRLQLSRCRSSGKELTNYLFGKQPILYKAKAK